MVDVAAFAKRTLAYAITVAIAVAIAVVAAKVSTKFFADLVLMMCLAVLAFGDVEIMAIKETFEAFRAELADGTTLFSKVYRPLLCVLALAATVNLVTTTIGSSIVAYGALLDAVVSAANTSELAMKIVLTLAVIFAVAMEGPDIANAAITAVAEAIEKIWNQGDDSSAIKLMLRGTDEEATEDDDNEDICVVCHVQKAVVASACCFKRTTCLSCSRILYQGKKMGSVKCMNCQGDVKYVGRIL